MSFSASPSFRAKLTLNLSWLVSDGVVPGSVYYPCQRLGA